jgi:hypothetical protein
LLASVEFVEEGVMGNANIDLRYSIHRCWDQAWSLCVAPVTDLSQAVSAAMRSATILFLWAMVQPESEGEAEMGNAIISFL